MPTIIDLKKKRGVYLVPKGIHLEDPLSAFAALGVSKSRTKKSYKKRIKFVFYGKPKMGKSSFIGTPSWVSFPQGDDKIGGTI